ncbi:hypothetical protein [Plantibacter flavus]|uniref:hypothetical protein n=1 Tax=Plantibacter flavus TaxID=150123 RepID=UPI00117C9C0E|nr:hypothetical protein [Plantibacter flavus]
MSELHDAFIRSVINANQVVLAEQEQAQVWVRQRSHLARLAHRNGVRPDDLAAAVGVPLTMIQEWLGPEPE